MLDLARLKRVRLSRTPYGQLVVAHGLLRWNYRIPRTEVVLEGLENLPSGPCMLAMNHTDMFNYFPLQYHFYRRGLPFTATWVKGKYYHNPFVAFFLMSTNNIPLPSRGYLISNDLKRALRRRPNHEEYRSTRDAVNEANPRLLEVPELGPDYLVRFEARWDAMVSEVQRLNRQALFELHNNVLVFPEGTRSVRLSEGHTGLVEMAMHLKVPMVPVGCSGSDKVYPSTIPIARGGRIVYRLGVPLQPDGPEIAPYRITEPYLPLSRQAGLRFGERFRAVTGLVMDRINELVDEPYRYAHDRQSTGVQGLDRFL